MLILGSWFSNVIPASFATLNIALPTVSTSALLTFSCTPVAPLSVSFGAIAFIFSFTVIGRGAMVFLFSIGKSAKEKSSGNVYIGNCGIKEVIITFVEIMIIGTLIVGPIRTISLIACSYIIVFLFNKYCNIKIGGLVGDTLGAGNELSEILTLIISNSYLF